jgi:thiamine-phosphate pyrophosphorylase
LSRPAPPPLYAIADAAALAPRSLADGVAAMAAAGVGWIQLRAKRLPGRDLHRQAVACAATAAAAGAALWLDDRADLAALLPVAGVHVGQRDLEPRAVRRVVGEGPWIGLSTHDEAQLRAADADDEVDVVAFGPIFPTAGKERPDPVVGLDGLRRARRLTRKPLIAIGGIDAGNVAAVLAAGADSAAVLGAVCRGDVAANCRLLLAAVAAG